MRYFSALFDPAFYTTPYRFMIPAWIIWALSWWVAALWSKRAASSASIAQEAPYRLATIAGVVLVFGFVDFHWLEWDVPDALGWTLFAFTVGGFLWCWWARLHLGTLWSSNVTRKEGHRIVDTGPYAITRHPIYTGLLTAILATGLARGRLEALVGALIVIFGTILKARLEERFLSETLGPDYAAYRKRVPMLVPFAPI